MPLIVTNSTPAATSPINATDGLRDIAPPVAIPSGYEWLWWTFGTVALVIAIILLVRWLQRRRATLAITPPIPAHIRARQKLGEALALIAQPKPFCIAVSDTLRGYLEERFTFRAPERTTEEFLHELQATTLLTPAQKTSLGNFLTNCDLVKFAKYEPGEPELLDLHASAVRLVDETEPTQPPVNANERSRSSPQQISSTIGKKNVADEMAKSADWISMALKSSGYRADFSPESLREIDRFFEEQSAGGTPKPGSLLANDVGQRIFAIGAYTGEVVRRNRGGTWVDADQGPDADINIELHLPDGTCCRPVQRAMKRLKNGAEDGIAAWGSGAGLEMRPREELQT